MMSHTVDSNHSKRFFCVVLALALVLVVAPALIRNGVGAQTSSSGPAIGTIQNPRPGTLLPAGPPSIGITLTQKQKDAILKANFKSTQRDVEKLSKLVQALDQEVKKSNPNVLSVSIVQRAGKIEKLARKIKKEAKAY